MSVRTICGPHLRHRVRGGWNSGMEEKARVLFICKKNETYGFTSYTRRSSGLYNSTRFIVESLQSRGVDANIVEVNDNNDIDREITKFKANVVILEALWVVPSKFLELFPLHKNVKWYCHLHSHIPFLALEGIAVEWLREYVRLGIGIIANSSPSYEALKIILGHGVLFLPNVYISHPLKPKDVEPHWNNPDAAIEIGCFGAIRPLKNQLLQAMAAIEFARQLQRPLRFHMNVSRTETGGDPVLKNIIELFANAKDAVLIQHAWHEPEELIHQMNMKLHIGMQVSLTETFNVVCADYVTAGIPVVASKEVYWLNPFSKARDDSIPSIVKNLHRAYRCKWLIALNQWLLIRFSNKAQKMWHSFILEIKL